MRLQPGGLGGQHRVRRDHAGLEADPGGAQILLGGGQVGRSRLQLVTRLSEQFALLGHLEGDQFLCLLQLALIERRFGLGFAIFARGFHPMEKRNAHQNPGVEHASVPAVAESVVKVRIGNQVVGSQDHFRQHVRAGDFRLAVIDLRGQREAARLGPVGEDAVHPLGPADGRLRDQVGLLVREHDRALQRQADTFAEEHLRKCKTVAGLGPEQVRLIGLDLDLQGVRLRHHTCFDGFLHVAFKRVEQFGIGVREPLLGGNGDDLPVGLVHIHDHVGVGLVVAGRLQLLGQACHLVGINDLAPHEHGLLQRDGRGEQVAVVQVKGVVHLGTDRIDRTGDIRRRELLQISLFQHAEHRLPHRAEGIFEHEFRVVFDLLLQLGAHRLGLLPDLGLGIGVGLVQDALGTGSQVPQCSRLAVADQRDIAVVVLIGSRGGNVGEIIGKRHLAVVACHLDCGLRLLEVPAGLDGHPAAVVEGQHLLCRRGAANQQEAKRYNVIASFHLFRHKQPIPCSTSLPKQSFKR